MSFQLPDLYVNPQFTWGPPEEELTIDDQPFHLYLKGDKLQVVDFRDEVDVAAEPPKRGGMFTTVKDETRQRALENERAKNKRPMMFNRRANPKQGRRRQERARRITELVNTYPIRSTTVLYADILQHDMAKLRMARPPQVSDLVQAGLPRVYDSEVDKVTCARPKLLDESNYDPAYYERQSITTDPVIRRLLRQYSGKVVVVSDEVLSLIMTSPMTMHPWHVEATRLQNIVFLDKDLESDTSGNVDRQWVSETASREIAPSQDDEVESLRISSLGYESTKAHDVFIKSSCKPTLAKMKTEANPFSKCQPRLYSYRNFKINPGTPDEYDVLVRCEIDSVTAENKSLRLFGLLEQPNKEGQSEWRKTMANGGTSELPKAFDMNRGKIGRWIALSNLSNAAFMKIGFLTRTKSLRAPNELAHEVIAVQTDTPQSLAAQLGIHVLTLWAIADHIISVIYTSVATGDTAMIVKPSGEGRIAVCQVDDEDDEDEEDDDDDDDDDDEDDE